MFERWNLEAGRAAGSSFTRTKDRPLAFWKRRKRPSKTEADPHRPMIRGVITVGGREWTVREEKRQGPREQILILKAADETGAEMHLRPNPGLEAKTIEDVEPLAFDPLYRWFSDAQGTRWETRLVISESANGYLAKFICWGVGVFEGPYPYNEGLGTRSDEELRKLLQSIKAQSGDGA